MKRYLHLLQMLIELYMLYILVFKIIFFYLKHVKSWIMEGEVYSYNQSSIFIYFWTHFFLNWVRMIAFLWIIPVATKGFWLLCDMIEFNYGWSYLIDENFYLYLLKFWLNFHKVLIDLTKFFNDFTYINM